MFGIINIFLVVSVASINITLSIPGTYYNNLYGVGKGVVSNKHTKAY